MYESLVKHGAARCGAKTPEYRIWCAMRERCNSDKHIEFKRYGGRGIRVCERWNNFANFLADMGPRPSPKHSIDRRDGDGQYEPSNCRWATPTEQRRNQRRALMLTFQGETMHVYDWAERLNLSKNTLRKRMEISKDPEFLLRPLRSTDRRLPR